MNSCSWILGKLIKSGKLARTNYNEYSSTEIVELPAYVPEYSNISKEIAKKLSSKYPYTQFVIFETQLLNEFLNHLIAQNTIFIHVEKEASIFVFRYLQESGYQNLLYKPTIKDYSLYWTNGSIVVDDLISEAPLSSTDPHSICLEKLLVDLSAEKLIRGLYNRSECPIIFEQVKQKYHIEKSKLLRYARRRNKENEIKPFLA